MNLPRLSPLSAPVSGVLRFLSLLCFALPLLAASARAASAPAVATIARMQPGPVTTADTLQWRVTFTEAVTGVDLADFELTQVDGAATATLGTVTAGANAAEYLVEATGVAGIGTLRLDVKSSGTGIVGGASNALSGGFTQGQAYTHALGTVPVAWGSNYRGQLGNGTMDGLTPTPTPVSVKTDTGVLAGKTVVAVSTGASHSLALCSDGTVAAWGFNRSGQLGNGATENLSTPVSVKADTGALAGKTVVAVSAGASHSLALCSDGTVVAWGSNSSGQLGDGSTADYAATTPTSVKTDTGALAGKTVVAVAAGYNHSLALCSDGTVVAWGYNLYGQLGNDSRGDSPTPVSVKTDTGALAGKTVVAVAAGYNHSLALCSDGTLVAWGYNNFGQLGNGATEDSSTPVAVKTETGALSGKTVVAVSAGPAHSLALCSDGTVAAWGGNNSGQLGNNSTESSFTPVAVKMDTGVLAGRRVYGLGSGCMAGHSLALASPAEAITAVEPPTAGTYKAGATLTFTLTTEAAVTVTGTPRLALAIGAETRYATYVSGSGTNSLVFTYTVAAGETDADGIAVASAIDLNGGTLIAAGGWPVALALPAYTLPAIMVDGPPAVATVARTQPGPVTTAGTLKWRVTFTEAVTGVDLADFALTTVAGTATATLGRVTAGANAAEYLVEATGVTGIGILRLDVKASGTGIVDDESRALVGGFTLGQSYTHAPGTVPVAWGRNFRSQLGLGTTDASAHGEPALVFHAGALADKTVVAVSAGGSHSLALCSDGTVVAWGYNFHGQLGNGSTADYAATTPTSVKTDTGALAGKTVVAVSAGGSHSLALCSDGTVAAWGYNYYGQLGSGSLGYYSASTPVLVKTDTGALAGKTVVAVSAGEDFSLALCSDGTLVAWGANDYGRLGNGSSENSDAPVLVKADTGALAGKTVVAVSAGGSHSLALCSDGTVVAWGRNHYGQLGDGWSVATTPVLVKTDTGALSGKTVVAVSAGQDFSLALCSDGTVAAWGYNYYGQLGSGSTENSDAPVLVKTDTGALSGKTVVAVSAGQDFSLALCSDGTVSAWGGNGIGQLGNGSTENSETPVPVKTETGALAGRTVYALGSGCVAAHSLALASLAEAITAVEPPTAGTYKAGATLTFTLTTEAAVTATGTPRLALTIGTETRYATYVAASSTGTRLVFTYTVAAGESDADGIGVASAIDLNGGTLIAAGGWPVALALPVYSLPAIKVDGPPAVATVARRQPGPVTLENTLKWRVTFTEAVTGVDLADFAVTTVDGTATATLGRVTAGANAAEYLVEATGVTGIGTLRLDVKASGTGIVDDESRALAGGFTLGQSYTHARGTAPVAWGHNEYGQLGLGTRTTDIVAHGDPALVPHAGALSGKAVVAVSAGPAHSLALCSDGTVAAWGRNQSGQLGNGTTEDSDTPVSVKADTGALSGKTVVAVSAGWYHSLALCSDGTVVAWGSGIQLGNDAMEYSLTPVLVDTTGVLAGKTVVAVSAGMGHSLALCSDGTVAAWGQNYSGQLGNGATENSPTPVLVRTETGALAGKAVVAVSAGKAFSLALCSDGTVAAWGYNYCGQLGNDSKGEARTPVPVDMTGALNGKRVVSVSAGEDHSLALCSDGTVAAWGSNAYGQLGNPFAWYESSSPVLVSTDVSSALAGKTVVAVLAGQAFSLALCSDGTMAAWGLNDYGQLGNGSMSGSDMPVSVKTETGALAGRTVYALGSGCGAEHSLALAAAANAIIAVEPPTGGTYKADDTLTFTLPTNEAATVTGTPRLALTVGMETRYATYASGSGTISLVFTYTVQAGDMDADGIAVASVIDLSGGTLTVAGDWPVALVLPAYTLPTIKVDAIPPTLPTVTLVSNNAAPTLAKAGDTVTLSFRASETLQAPTVTLAGKSATVSYDSGTSTWTATHTVAVDDTEGAVAFSVAFSDVGGNAGTTVTATTDSSAVTIDLTRPETPAALVVPDASRRVSGRAESGSTVTVYLNGEVAWTVQVGGDGTWFYAVPPTLGDGEYEIAYTVTDAAGNVSVMSASSVLRVARRSLFAALSARAPAGTGEQTLILGFVFAGGGKPTLVRGVGPGISTVSGYMRDPQLRLYTASGVEVASNDDWAGSSELSDAFVRTGAGALDPASKDAALFENLTGNVYTAHVSGAAGTTGVALAEAYDASLGDKTKRLTALSVRNQVGVDDAILIAGFVISGDVPKRVVVRGVGPGISTVSGYLRDPQLQVWRLNTLVTPAKWELVGENDDWDHTATTAALFKSVGMGELASDSKDAALVLTLEPGIYTAQVSGVGRTTGVGLAEIYEAP